MFCARMLALKKKEIASLTFKTILERQCGITCGINSSQQSQIRQYSKNADVIHDTKIYPMDASKATTLLEKAGNKLRFWNRKRRMMAVGPMMLDNILENIDYLTFFKDFNMPDTFFSWFLVTELHVWMLSVRYMCEGKDGKLIRDSLITALWEDVNVRMDKICTQLASRKRKHMVILSSQLNAAFLDYDEGLLSNDKMLAGAIWRRMFVQECCDPEKVERLVHYVRKQIYMMDKIPSPDILYTFNMDWIDIKSIR